MSESAEQLKREYRSYALRKFLFVLVCLILAILMFWLSLGIGTRELGLWQSLDYFLDHISGKTYPAGTLEWYDELIIWNYRVPRAIFSLIAGGGLSVAGAVMQGVMKNPLADPYTTGVSSGAYLGASVAIVLGFSLGGSIVSGSGIIINAIVFSMMPIIAIAAMGPYFRKSPASLILAGVAISSAFSSVTSLLLISTDNSSLEEVYKWSVGTLTEITWDSLPLVTVVEFAGLLILIPISNKINLMALDDKDAKSMGLDSERLRVICLVILSVMAAVVICYAGVIGFVGLIVPHIIRLILGSDNKYLIPASAGFGAAFLLTCDVISRMIDVSATVPVGVVTSFIGAPIFLGLIILQRKGMW